MAIYRDLEKHLKAGIRRYNVPGASIAIYRNGRVHSAAAGVLNVDTGVTATTDSVFQIGSISKVFTATLILQLADAGLVDIDAPLADYLPGFRVADPVVSRTVTLRQLLSHTSGIEGDYFVDSGRGEDAIARLQDMGALLPSLFPPGERMSYCNFGYAMLGRVIEVVTGETFDQAIRRRLFKPLGMTHALTLPEDTVRYRTAIGHVPHPDKPGVNVQTPMPWLSIGQKAAGATPSMSAPDLMKFVDMHLNGGRNPAGDRILSPARVREMQRAQIALPRHTARGVHAWGLGWFLLRWSGQALIGHDGGTVGQYSFLRVLPKQRLAVALLTNGGNALNLAEQMFAQTLEPLGRVHAPALPEPKPGVRVDAERLCGTYENLTTVNRVARQGENLTIAIEPKTPGGAPLPATPLHFIDRNTAVLRTGEPALDAAPINFQQLNDGPARYLGVGFRLARRTG
ncbi:MAG: serine hydrolase domain-containing protein [Pseudomonadales bacterium]